MSLKDFIFINKLIVYLTKFIYDAFTVGFYDHLVLVEVIFNFAIKSKAFIPSNSFYFLILHCDAGIVCLKNKSLIK